MIRRIRLPLAAVGAVAVALVGAGSAAAATPAADCQPYGAQPCLLPSRTTCLRKSTHEFDRAAGSFARGGMPVNGAGSRIKVGDYDRADGFSPGSALIVHVADSISGRPAPSVLRT